MPWTLLWLPHSFVCMSTSICILVAATTGIPPTNQHLPALVHVHEHRAARIAARSTAHARLHATPPERLLLAEVLVHLPDQTLETVVLAVLAHLHASLRAPRAPTGGCAWGVVVGLSDVVGVLAHVRKWLLSQLVRKKGETLRMGNDMGLVFDALWEVGEGRCERKTIQGDAVCVKDAAHCEGTMVEKTTLCVEYIVTRCVSEICGRQNKQQTL